MDLAELKNRLIASIDRRYQGHAGKDLTDYIFSNYLFHTPEPALVDFSYKYREEIAGYLAEQNHLEALVEYCVVATKGYTYQRNQFINLPHSYDKLLYAEYRDFFQQIGLILTEATSRQALALAYAETLQRHHERLKLILSSYCLACYGENLEENPLLRTVPCEEYSVPFQLRLLNISVDRLSGPVLDLGCGTAGTLVHFLRGKGLTAFGLDRLASSGSHFFQVDWFDFDYGRQSWGTIIAHQSFSTHFIYNHLHNPPLARRYARLFMRILAGLKPGGAFYYAPGLPFVEDDLEKVRAYSVDRTPIPTKSRPEIGQIFYAVKISEGNQTA